MPSKWTSGSLYDITLWVSVGVGCGWERGLAYFGTVCEHAAARWRHMVRAERPLVDCRSCGVYSAVDDDVVTRDVLDRAQVCGDRMSARVSNGPFICAL